MDRRLFLAVLVATIALLASCFSPPKPVMKSTYGEHFFRVDAERDTVDWIAIEHGLHGLRGHGGRRLQALLDGMRMYPAGGLDSLDLDPPPSADAQETDSAEGKSGRAGRAVVHVEEARLVLDTNKAPTLWRRITIDHAADWLDVFHETKISRIEFSPFLFRSTWGPFDATQQFLLKFPYFDLATFELQRRADESGRKPWSLQGSSIVFEGPASPEYADRCRHEWASGPAAGFASTQPEVLFDGTTLALRFTPDGSGWICAGTEFSIENETPYRMRHHLLDRGFTIEPQETYARLRASAGLP